MPVEVNPSTNIEVVIRGEKPSDRAGIRVVHERAFGSPGEAMLVDLLRRRHKLTISLVAESNDRIVGHVAFSPVEIVRNEQSAGEMHPDTPISRAGLGLAPLAVLPEFQNRGIGAQLTEQGLRLCRTSDTPFVVVLGDPEYYGRFGFTHAFNRFGLCNEYDARKSFQAIEIVPNCLSPASGALVRYAPEFREVEL